MFCIECPFCHEQRNESEFTYAGEAFIERPAEPESVDDEAWADYLFHRTNTKGVFLEQWSHSSGCRKYFVVQRHTVSHEITASYTLAKAASAIANTKPADKLETTSSPTKKPRTKATSKR